MSTDFEAKSDNRAQAARASRLSIFAALLLLLLAALLRVTSLASVPNGFSEDEIINIRLADNVRQGDIYVFFPDDDAGGREGAWHVISAFVTYFTGEGTIGFRLLPLWLSMLSIAIIFKLGRHVFGPLAGLLAAGMLAVNLSSIILARSMSADATVIFLVSATMLALARSLPVYRRAREITSNVMSFAVLGALLGIGLYLHPGGLFIALACVIYIAYLLYVRAAMLSQRRGYIGFALLVMLIIAIPYVISSLNVPEYAVLARRPSIAEIDIPGAILSGVFSIVGGGDMNPLRNPPGRPLVDIFCGLLALVGVAQCIRLRFRPRFMLLLIMGLVCLPAALLVGDSPNFARMALILPQLSLFFGFGAFALLRAPIFADRVFRRMAMVGALALLAVNLVWAWQDLLVVWGTAEVDRALADRDLGQIAHYLDIRGDDMPSVFCNANWRSDQLASTLTDSDKLRIMMNRSGLPRREADCSRGLLLTDGGAPQRIVFFGDSHRDSLHPYLRQWLDYGDSVKGALPRDAVHEMDVAGFLADRAGEFITMAPVWYDPEVAGGAVPVPPPIRFGSNLTFLGYEPQVERSYLPGDNVDVITYWRAEGSLPPDLTLFTHILSDPVTLVAQHDVISVNPAQLRDRDVFIQATTVSLPQTALPGDKFVSVGAYREAAGERLPALQGERPYGERIFLYAIQVSAPPEPEESGA